MYHLSQEEFLGSWEPIREGDACIIAQDEGFLENEYSGNLSDIVYDGVKGK